MIDKEKVRELALKINSVYYKEVEQLLTEWLEQNQPSPVVVGLSDEQVYDIAQLVASNPDEFTKNIQVMGNYLKAQTFAQPEVKEIPVGLSDEQFKDLVFHLDMAAAWTDCNLSRVMKSWLDKQKFSHYNNEGKVLEADGEITDYKSDYERVAGYYVELEKEYSKVKKELEQPHKEAKHTIEQLLGEISKCHEELKSRQLKPNWEDAPDWAEWLANGRYGDWLWFETKPNNNPADFHFSGGGKNQKASVRNWRQTLEQRPQPPAPKVEVGQVWLKKGVYPQGYKYTVLFILETDDKIKNKLIVYQGEDESVFADKAKDFLTKFERVLQ